MNKRIKICDIPVDDFNYSEVLESVSSLIHKKRKVYFVTVNPEMMLNASQDDEFASVISGAEIVTPDGIGILWAASYLAKPKKKVFFSRFFQLFASLFLIVPHSKSVRNVLRQRVTGVDLFKKMVDECHEKGWRIFLLGASEGVADRVIKRFSKSHSKAKFVGCFSGTPSEIDEVLICERINNAKPDILFVAYGSPDQEFWIYRNLFKLDTVNVAIGVGGAFDFWSGRVKRAPKFMQKIGMEWLWRLFREPKRFIRIWNATFRFIQMIYSEKNRES